MPKFLWTQRTGFGPSPRIGCAMAFDSQRGRTVLFGGDGLGGDFKAETWEWDGSFWTQMNDIGPTPRRDPAMAYDSARQVTVLFGGRSAQGFEGDTWQWDGQDWTQLSASGPPLRAAHTVAFDIARNRTVLFGGGNDIVNFADTWEFDGTEWTKQDDTGPSERIGHAMAYDPVKSRIILFGGESSATGALGDTWSWDGATWTRIAEIGPPARFGAAMVSPGDGVILYGGISKSHVFADTWEFDGKLWTQRQDIGPGPRWSLGAAFDTLRNRAVLFGGIRVFVELEDPAARAQLLGDTWEHTAPAVEPPQVESIAVDPSAAVSGQLIALTITLSKKAARPLPVLVRLSSQLGVFGAGEIPPAEVPAGTLVFATHFRAPQAAVVWNVTAQVAGVEGAQAATTILAVG